MQELIRMVSSAGTGYSYYTKKNKKNVPDKLVLKKYDPRVRRVVEFTEGKVHKGNK